ncbi:MAG: cytochrome-c oxidase [Oligoflexia bacterium]|nr:MAG: cytochrome-c oxidase [Oligoflexia bacterium]
MSTNQTSHHQMTFVQKYIFSTDHKVIGMQYMITGLIMAFLGGFLAYGFRMQLAFPGEAIPLLGKMTAGQYNEFITMHGTIMIFWVAMPVLLAALGNLLIPIMIGADDMAFPTLNMISYWVFFLSTVVLIASFFVPGGAFAGGWTAYPPLSANGYTAHGWSVGLGGNLWIIAVALEFVAFLIGGINFIVTTFNMRAPGLTWFRLPMMVWMMLSAVLIFMFAVGPLIAGAAMLLLDRTVGTGFYNPAAGGDPILFQHMFWFFGHPEVYVILLPTIGVLAEVMTTFARKPIFGYKMIIYATIGAGFLSFVVWAHHQFIAGIDPRMATFFSITTIMISIPFSLIIFASIATLWKSSITLSTPMLFALGFIGEFLIGGVTGIYLGSSAFDIYVHDTYFVIAHFHYALIPTVFFGGLAAIYFWFPKFIGRMYNETLGKVHFWLTTISFNLVFFPLFFSGMAGEHRRIFDYSMWKSLMTPEIMNIRIISTLALIVLFLSQFIFVFNMIKSALSGPKAEKNPWKSNTLEWQADSPPPHGNFAQTPVVHRGPYEYSVPGRSEDYWPQTSAN